jgi:Short C-terminal domain
MRRRRWFEWLAVGVALWSLGCAAPRVTRSIYQQGEAGKSETFVRLDRVADGERFDHPAQIPPARLRELLASVAVQRQTGLLSVIFAEKPFRAFSDAELDLLSAQFAKALAEATPEEVVVFYLNAPESNERLRITSGGVYVRQGKLVVIIANYHYPVLWSDSGGARSSVSISSSRDNPLYAYPEGLYQLVVGKGQERLGGKQSWFNYLFGAVNRKSGVLLALNAPPPPAPQEKGAEESGSSAPEPAAAPPSSPAEAAAPQLHMPPPVVLPPAQAPPSIVPEAPAAVSPLEEKLRLLKKLLDDGLITEADYEAKKQELLKNF